MEKYLILIGKTNTGYSAHCPDVPGCAATGSAIDETLDRMKTALTLHFEGMAEDGEPIPKPRGVDRYREIVADDDSDQYLIAHVAMDAVPNRV